MPAQYIFLPANGSHTVGTVGELIFGVVSGFETVRIPNDTLSGLIIDAYVDRIEFPLPVASYKFEAYGTAVKVFMGATLIATVGVKTSDANGTRFVFADGAAQTQLNALDSSNIGGMAVPQTAGGATVAPTLDSGDCSTTTQSGGSFNLTGGSDSLVGSNADDTFTAPDGTLSSSDTIDGYAGVDILNVQGNTVIASGSLNNVSNIETINFSNTTANIVLTTVEALVAPGAVLTLQALALSSGTLSFTGSAEVDGGRFEISGGQSNDSILGGSGNDGLSGVSGNDTLVGGPGNDKLTGGLGNDSLIGGTGADTYIFVAPNDGADTIAASEFVTGTDKFSFNGTAFALSSLTAAADTNFTTDVATTLGSVNGKANSDFYRVQLTGANLATALYDSLDSAMAGGAHTGAALFVLTDGVDTVLVYDPDTYTAAAGTVVELVKLFGASGYTAVASTDLELFSSANFFTLTAGVDSFTGTTFADQFNATNLTLTAGDMLDGGAGPDTLVLNTDGVLFSIGAGHTISNIEMLQLGNTANDIGFGASITGLSQINGGTANDTIDIASLATPSISAQMGDGSDILKLGALSYTGMLDGGTGTDTLYLAANANISGAMVANNFEEVVLHGAATMSVSQHSAFTSITGAGGSDVITLISSGPATLTGSPNVEGYVLSGAGPYDFTNGFTGSVSVTGSAGNDSFAFAGGELTAADVVNGGAGADTISVTGNTAIAATDLNGVTYVETVNFDNTNTNIVLTTVDGLVASGATLTIDASMLTGTLTFDGTLETNGSFSITSGDGNDMIKGGAGNDTLIGGAGSDTLKGGAGADTLEAGTPGDVLDYAALVADTSCTASSIAGVDKITVADFNAGSGTLLNLDIVVTNIGTAVTGSLTEASFVADMNTLLAVGGGAGFDTSTAGTITAAIVTANVGDLNGRRFLAIDLDQNDTFTATDFVVEITGATVPSLTSGVFVTGMA